MIYRYNQWLEESEKVDATVPAIDAPAADPSAAPAPPAEMDETEPKSVEEIDDSTEIGKFKKLDQARRDAVKAFKEKQKEFLEMPEESRKNPTSDEDKQKVQTLKDELIALNKTMKDAESAFNKFNDEMLGLSADVENAEGDEDIEP